jgi:DNA-binding response OmpR family regulator
LVRAGLEITPVHDGRNAYVYLFQNRNNMPDLVVLRVGLPLFTGLEILNQMRAEPHTQNIPVILLADSTDEQHALEVLDLPLCSCFVKPLTFAKLVYALPRLNLRINESLLYQAMPSPS